jgi:hypothetical protein
MVPQLSTSEELSQPLRPRFLRGFLAKLGASWIIGALLVYAPLSVAQTPDFDVVIEPLTAIDRQFMDDQRQRVEQLANRLGRGLTADVDRDLDTLQRILDDSMVRADDSLTLQAMGLVFGDLLGQQLDMDWVVYRDRKGRSRALRYREMDIFLFPVTMISRRQQGGSDRRLKQLFEELVDDTRRQLPGGKWFQ